MLLSAVFSMLLVGGALSAPSPSHARRESFIRNSQLSRRTFPPPYNINWAGAVISDSSAAWQSVHGEFVIPAITAPAGLREAFISVWVAVDGYTCATATLKVGMDIEIKNGVTTYTAWDEYLPAQSGNAYTVENAPGLALAAGDTISLTAQAVTGEHPNFPETLIENLSAPYTVGHYFNPSPALCQTDAIWGVEFWEAGDLRQTISVGFVNSGAVRGDGTFVGLGNATAMDGDGGAACATSATGVLCTFYQSSI